MKAREEYKAKIADYEGIIRGKIPAPLVRLLGARHGDHIVFKVGPQKSVTLHVERAAKSSKKKARGRR